MNIPHKLELSAADCEKLGHEYLQSAQKVLDRVKVLKSQANYHKDKYRVGALYRMGLECKRIGQELLKRSEPLKTMPSVSTEKIQWYDLELTPLKMFRLLKRYSEDQGEYDWKIRKLVKVMNYALEHELTPSQKECIEQKYMNGLKNVQIAEQRGVSQPVVCRTIARGLKILRHVLQYACFFEKEEVDDDDRFGSGECLGAEGG